MRDMATNHKHALLKQVNGTLMCEGGFGMSTWHRSSHLRWWSLAGVVVLLFAFVMLPQGTVAQDSVLKRAAQGKLRASEIRTPAGIKRSMMISGGTLASAQGALPGGEGASGLDELREDQADLASSADTGVIGLTDNTLGCTKRKSNNNTRVNQDCTYRRQAEEIIKANPTNSENLIAGQNDSRIGFNHCGFDYSFDGGDTWGDGIPPFFQRTNDPPAGHTVGGGPGTGGAYQVASDPAVAFDSRGNAYYSCILFDINTNASAVLVARSPAVAGGAFYNNVPASGTNYVVDEENSAKAILDKEFITADSYTNSPFRDNVYATWTIFNFTCGAQGDSFCGSKIYFAKSSDGALTWTAPREIGGKNKDLCTNFFNPADDPNACNNSSGSDPIVLPDGTIVVVFNNGNTAANNPNLQQLAVVSKDGGNTWSKPVKAGDDIIQGEPLCNVGRGPEECIPGAFIRTNDFPRIAVDKSNGDVYATWQDYRNGEFDIILSKSSDSGKTWKEAGKPVNRSQNRDHYFAAIDVGKNGKVAVSYYRTERVPNENTTPADGFTPGRDAGVQARNSDYFLAGGKGLNTPFEHRRVAQPFPPPDGVQAGFNGDYSGIVAIGDEAVPIWSDTRNTALAQQGVIHDEDIFISVLDIPGD
jgi:hypothetical protein